VFPLQDNCLNSNSIRMIQPIVESRDAVTLVGGGPVAARDLKLALARAPLAVAADSGADRLLRAGVTPQAVIGDFDSLSPETRAALPPDRLHRLADQDTTDFDKALARIAAPLVLALGFQGARIDHGLAVLNALVRHPARPCLVLGPKDFAFACPPELTLAARPGEAFSLFPLAPLTAESEGLYWPLQGLRFAPDGMIGTSNRVTTRQVWIRVSGPGMVVILPRARLDAAISALAPGLAVRRAARGG
jgi:thiamine pyrophosphokinase